MGSRSRLQDHMELMAQRKQKDFEKQEEWKNKIKYYEHWDKHNSQYGNWTSEKYYENSTYQYDEDRKKKDKEEMLKVRRDKLRKLLQEEENEYDMEILESPRDRRNKRRSNEIPTNVLKEVNIGLKLADEDRKRHEAELKLYHKWRNENPIVRDYESNQNTASLKLAWLDQQIEKRMAQEKSEEETKMMIEERDRLILQEKQIEKEEIELRAKTEQKLLGQIEEQLKAFKINEERYEALKNEEDEAMRKKWEIEELIERRKRDMEKRKIDDLALFNINQSKMKLRKKALQIEEDLRNEQLLIEDIEKTQAVELAENAVDREQTKASIQSYLKFVREQQALERKRQQFISIIFDSEAKNMWLKQERLWKEEQINRDKLLQDVLNGIRDQIQYKIDKNIAEKLQTETEKQQALVILEEADRKLKEEKEKLQNRKLQRKMELDKQIHDQNLIEREKEMEEQKKKNEELESIRKEEERLRNELMMMQRGKYHPSRFTKRNMFW